MAVNFTGVGEPNVGSTGTTGGTLPGEPGATPGQTTSPAGGATGPSGPSGPGSPPVTVPAAPVGAGGPTGVGTYPNGTDVNLTPDNSWSTQPASSTLNEGYRAALQALQHTLPGIRGQIETLAHRGIGG